MDLYNKGESQFILNEKRYAFIFMLCIYMWVVFTLKGCRKKSLKTSRGNPNS